MAERFGAQLRQYRVAAGLSLGQLAKLVHFSKGYLSKIENDVKPPSLALARLCDSALDAGGALIALVAPRSRAEQDDTPADSEVWVMALDESGELRFMPVDRRQLLAAGAGAMLGFALTRSSRPPAVDERVLPRMRESFDQIRRLGMVTSPAIVLPAVITHVHSLRGLAQGCAEPLRSELLLLASRVAEYAGWMSQEAGDNGGALWWTDQAVKLTRAGREDHLASYALVRRAEIALYQQDALTTVALARNAQSDPAVGTRILGLAARCEAQGHALAGDFDAYLRAFDRATEWLNADDAVGANGPVLGSTSVADQAALAAGWALLDLGRPAEAAEILDREVIRIPDTAKRARARFGARRVLAHAVSGEIDHACTLARQVLDDAMHVDSATIRLDLRELARTLSRWRSHGSVGELYPELTAALRTVGRQH